MLGSRPASARQEARACQDLLSIQFVSTLWGAPRRDLWPKRAILS